MTQLIDIRMTVNGREYTGRAEPRLTLADFIRQELNLTGTHLGCEHGVCGACTILVDGAAIKSSVVGAARVITAAPKPRSRPGRCCAKRLAR